MRLTVVRRQSNLVRQTGFVMASSSERKGGADESARSAKRKGSEHGAVLTLGVP